MEIVTTTTTTGRQAAFDFDELLGLKGAALLLRASVAEFGWPTAPIAEGFFESFKCEEFLQDLNDTLSFTLDQLITPD